MRVLCKQNECPICRRINQKVKLINLCELCVCAYENSLIIFVLIYFFFIITKVIFTSEILPYKELDQKNRSCLYDKTFRITFTGQRALNAFRRLLEHTCNK